MPVLADRVKETSTTNGTGTLSLAGAVDGYQTFVAGIGTGNTVYYSIVDDNDNWESGTGTVTDASPDTLSRDTVHASSNGGLAVNFPIGTKTIFANPITQFLKNPDVTKITVGLIDILSGAGDPEGAVTAPQGSQYNRTGGGAGTTFYVKESGAGNTGWVGK